MTRWKWTSWVELVDAETDAIIISTDYDGNLVTGEDCTFFDPESRNGRLIVAAPEMKEILEDLVKGGRYDHCIDRARDLLAKINMDSMIPDEPQKRTAVDDRDKGRQ
jgi:hypothetical protein